MYFPKNIFNQSIIWLQKYGWRPQRTCWSVISSVLEILWQVQSVGMCDSNGEVAFWVLSGRSRFSFSVWFDRSGLLQKHDTDTQSLFVPGDYTPFCKTQLWILYFLIPTAGPLTVDTDTSTAHLGFFFFFFSPPNVPVTVCVWRLSDSQWSLIYNCDRSILRNNTLVATAAQYAWKSFSFWVVLFFIIYYYYYFIFWVKIKSKPKCD